MDLVEGLEDGVNLVGGQDPGSSETADVGAPSR